MANKVFSGVYVDYTQIPEMIEIEGVKYYRIRPVDFNPAVNLTTEFMNTTYYSMEIGNGEQVTYIIENGVKYYSVPQNNPGDGYVLQTINRNGVTYYAYIKVQADNDAPDTIIVNGKEYSKYAPDSVNDWQSLETIKVNALYYAVNDIEAPATIEVNGVTYYKEMPNDPQDGHVLKTVDNKGVIYYAWVAPDTIEINGITYYKEQPSQPGGDYELVTAEQFGITYYAWVQGEQQNPDSIDVNGITYYLVAPENPGEGYELKTTEYNGDTYYAWIYVGEPEPVLPDYIDVNGVTYYKEQPAKPGENYELSTYDYEGTTYYAWIAIVEPGEGFYYYVGLDSINSQNYTELASLITEYPAQDSITVSGEHDVLILLKEEQEISLNIGMFHVAVPDPVASWDGYKLIVVEDIDESTLTITFE